MIYGKSHDGSLVIGLSERNIELLREGHPIVKELPEMPALLIVYGQTEAEILSLLTEHGLVGNDSRVRMMHGDQEVTPQ